MSLFANIEETNDIQESGDVLGGGNLLPSDVYEMTIKSAYVMPAASGAIGVHLQLEGEGGKSLRNTQYVTSGTAKGGKNYYERNGEKRFLPGYELINDLCLLVTNNGLTALEDQFEEKVVPIYNFDAKAEVPTKVPVIMPLINQKVKAGVLQVIEDKNKRGDDGNYYPTGETRDLNEVNKFFHAETGLTVTEARAGLEQGQFIDSWLEKNKERVVDKSGKSTGGAKAGAPSAPGKPAAPAAAARPSLFPQK